MHIFTLANNKGGVTKTTTTINLAYGLARIGRRVLVVDRPNAEIRVKRDIANFEIRMSREVSFDDSKLCS